MNTTMNTTMKRRAGVTLIELVVALAIVGISSAVVLLEWKRTQVDDDAESRSFATLIADARRRAITTGRTQQLSIRLSSDGVVLAADDSRTGSVLRSLAFHADGSVVAAPALGMDRIAGQLRSTGQAVP